MGEDYLKDVMTDVIKSIRKIDGVEKVRGVSPKYNAVP